MIKFVFYIVHILLVGFCYSIYLNKFVSPNFFPYFQFAAIILPILIAVHFVLIMFWFLSGSYIRALSIAVISFGLLGLVNNVFNWKDNKVEMKNSDIKVMSYNLHYFKDGDYKSINSLIESEKPDVLFIQEFRKHQLDSIAYLVDNNFKIIKYPYVGIATRYKVLKQGQTLNNTKRGHVCYADVRINDKTVRLISAYLEPFHIIPEMLESDLRKEELEKNYYKLKELLVKSFKAHESQLEQTMPFISKSEYPIILGGDLNSVPNSYEYFKFTKYLDDAFLKSEKIGMATTFNTYELPLRLDYIFTSKILKASNYKTIKSKLSDHQPVSANISLP